MKAVLIPIQPKWVEKIASGKKTIEVRKTAPKQVPFKAYIYCTFPKKPAYTLWLNRGTENKFLADGKVIGEFVCDWITKITPHCDIDGFVNQYIHGYPAILGDNDCLSFNDMKAYLGNKKGYYWHISDLKIYDKPKEMREFFKPCPTKEKGDCFDCDCLADNDYGGICTNNLTRAPSNWQYVEEL